MTLLIIILIAIGGAVAFFVLKRKTETAPIVLSPLPDSDTDYPSIFQAWNGIEPFEDENKIALHDIFWHVPEGFGVMWSGRTEFTAPSLAGVFDAETVPLGLAKRDRLKSLNPNIKLFVQIGYTEGLDGNTDFPPDHSWWLRANGARVPGWGGSYKFNLDLPAVRKHCADCCEVAMDTGIWDGIILDSFTEDANHLDILYRVRALIGDAPIIVNAHGINPSLAPLVNGFFMEEGTMSGKEAWQETSDALDFNERHVRQPALNCLEIAGYRVDLETMRMGLCLMLTRGNGYFLMADPGPNYASTHKHEWYAMYSKSLGKPVSNTREIGVTSRREYEHGTVVYNPFGAATVTLTFPESRLSMGSGVRSVTHELHGGDGGLYIK